MAQRGPPYRETQSPERAERDGTPTVASIPATVATAAILLASLQASADAMNAPFEYPATYTLGVDTQRAFEMAYERDQKLLVRTSGRRNPVLDRLIHLGCHRDEALRGPVAAKLREVCLYGSVSL
jgi:hypothetical protein